MKSVKESILVSTAPFDGILKEPFSVQYMRVDDVISGIMSLGLGTLLAKFDVESAYRNIPVHPEDCYLLGMKW